MSGAVCMSSLVQVEQISILLFKFQSLPKRWEFLYNSNQWHRIQVCGPPTFAGTLGYLTWPCDTPDLSFRYATYLNFLAICSLACARRVIIIQIDDFRQAFSKFPENSSTKRRDKSRLFPTTPRVLVSSIIHNASTFPSSLFQFIETTTPHEILSSSK